MQSAIGFKKRKNPADGLGFCLPILRSPISVEIAITRLHSPGFPIYPPSSPPSGVGFRRIGLRFPASGLFPPNRAPIC